MRFEHRHCTVVNVRPSKSRDAAACAVARCRRSKATRDAIARTLPPGRRRNALIVVRSAHAATAARRANLQRGPKEGHLSKIRVLYDRPHHPKALTHFAWNAAQRQARFGRRCRDPRRRSSPLRTGGQPVREVRETAGWRMRDSSLTEWPGRTFGPPRTLRRPSAGAYELLRATRASSRTYDRR